MFTLVARAAWAIVIRRGAGVLGGMAPHVESFLSSPAAPSYLALSVAADLARGALWLDFRSGESCPLRAAEMGADLLRHLNTVHSAGTWVDTLSDMLPEGTSTGVLPKTLGEILATTDLGSVQARTGRVSNAPPEYI